MAELDFVQIPTGRTHQVNGIYEPILDEQGEPETEWALVAVVEGHRVPLQTFSVGFVAHQVSRDDTAVDSSSSSTPPATTGAGDQTELEQAQARIAELEAQLAQQSSSTTGGEGSGTANAGDQPPQ